MRQPCNGVDYRTGAKSGWLTNSLNTTTQGDVTNSNEPVLQGPIELSQYLSLK